MTSRRRDEGCRICGGDLQGNQRRWLFAAHKKGQNHSPTRSVSKESAKTLSPSWSTQSSPWGSTLSLGSSHSLYKSHTLATPSKGMDLLAVLTDTLGQSVPRGNGRGEFICGKCVSVLERVFKFDTVIARVRLLSKERLQKLTQERDGLRRWVRMNYRQHDPFGFRTRKSSSEDDIDLREDGGRHGDPGKGYREMLSDNMALVAYECWTEKRESCPYFKRTGKRCNKSKNCECCDSLRVSDSDYESVCGIPRHLPEEVLSPFGLSRDKSQSMPLHWSGEPSLRSSPTCLSGSCHSLEAQTRGVFTQSTDSLDGQDPFDWPEENQVILDSILENLKSIEGKPIMSPAGSRIPVLSRRRNGSVTPGSASSQLVQVLNFGDGDGDEMNGELEDVLTELRDEFLVLHREKVPNARVHLAVRQLQEKLDQAQARIRTLEAGIQGGTQSDSCNTCLSKTSPTVQVKSSSEDDGLIHDLSHTLRSREKVIQECLSLIRMLCVELGTGIEAADKLISKVSVSINDTRSDREGVLEAELSELKEKGCGLQKELKALQQANRDQERDLLILNTVLQSNQDVINHLRVELAEKTQSQVEMQNERELWKERDLALETMSQEKDVLISRLQEALESAHNDVQALSDSLIGRGLSGGGAEAALATQVREQESLLSSCLKDWEAHTATTREEVSKLLTALEKADAVVQEQRRSHKQTITELSEQLRDTRKELRETIKETKQAGQAWKSEIAERDSAERKLKECLQNRDKLIEQILLDAEKRDGMLLELHQNISSRVEPRVGLKHTL